MVSVGDQHVCRLYTWGHNQENLIMSKIDRIFCTTEFDASFPMASSRVLPRVGSDHTPVVWESGVEQRSRKSSFKFEKWWLIREYFSELVRKIWFEPTGSSCPLESWKIKIRRFRKATKGWSSNIEVNLESIRRALWNDMSPMYL